MRGGEERRTNEAIEWENVDTNPTIPRVAPVSLWGANQGFQVISQSIKDLLGARVVI